MGSDALPYLLTMAITSLFWLAGSALVRSRRVSRSTRAPKSTASSEPNPDSVESRLARVEADQASLFSTLEKLTTTVKRVSSRQGMRDLREREDAAPGPNATKAEVRAYYLRGKSHADVARMIVNNDGAQE